VVIPNRELFLESPGTVKCVFQSRLTQKSFASFFPVPQLFPGQGVHRNTTEIHPVCVKELD
jgi:hypothetical protein